MATVCAAMSTSVMAFETAQTEHVAPTLQLQALLLPLEAPIVHLLQPLTRPRALSF